MRVTWNQVVEQCNVPIELSVVISSDTDDHPWSMLSAGRIIERLQPNEVHIKKLENWIWFQFNNIADAAAFKLSQEE